MPEFKRRGRPPKNPEARIEEKKEQRVTERRRRKVGVDHGRKLDIPMEAKERLGREYQLRWTNDEGSRVYDRTVNDDYDYVTPEEIGAGDDGTGRVSVVVGRHERGEPMRAYLMKKRLDYYEADQKAKADATEESEAAIFRGEHAGAEQNYVPPGGISVKR